MRQVKVGYNDRNVRVCAPSSSSSRQSDLFDGEIEGQELAIQVNINIQE